MKYSRQFVQTRHLALLLLVISIAPGIAGSTPLKAVQSATVSCHSCHVYNPLFYEGALLPPVLLSFFGEPNGDDNIVTWKFDGLTGLLDVSLQRSTDKVNFTTIAYWTSDDNEAKINFIDKQPPAISFYRIVYTTTGAVAAVSDTIQVSHRIVPGWLVRSDFARGKINLSWRNIPAGNYSLRLFNVQGMSLNRTMFAVNAQSQSIQIPVGALSAGILLLVVYNNSGTPVFTDKLLFYNR